MTESDYVTISVREEERDALKSLKRGGETYSTLIRDMLEQFDPEERASYRVRIMPPEDADE